jgi:hypothetical protein
MSVRLIVVSDLTDIASLAGRGFFSYIFSTNIAFLTGRNFRRSLRKRNISSEIIQKMIVLTTPNPSTGGELNSLHLDGN